MQAVIGSCQEDDIAFTVATRVVGHYPHRNEMLVDCGFTGISHDGRGAYPGGSYCVIKGEPNLRYNRQTKGVNILNDTPIVID